MTILFSPKYIFFITKYSLSKKTASSQSGLFIFKTTSTIKTCSLFQSCMTAKMWYANIIIDRGLLILKAKELIFFVVLFIINLNVLLSSSQPAFHKLLSGIGCTAILFSWIQYRRSKKDKNNS